MSEYIKREDAIAKEEIIITNTGREVCAVRTCNLWEIPAADVEPVVRCRQCRYSGSSENGYEECLITDSIHQPDFYCALGKKCGA